MFLFGAFTLSSCGDERKRAEEELNEIEPERAQEEPLNQEGLDDVIVTAEGNPELSTFALQMNAVNLSETLGEGDGPYTIFAPSNLAYSLLAPNVEDEILKTDNETVIRYMVTEGELTAEELRERIEMAGGEYQLEMLQGENITATLEGETIVLQDGLGNTANISNADLPASNGVVHVIDTVLLPLEADTDVIPDAEIEE